MTISDNIYIIGAGAIGKTLALFLTLEGRNVTLLRASADDIPAYFEKYSVTLSDGSIPEAEVKISALSHFSSLDGLVVFANKSFGNTHLAKAFKAKTGSTPIVILQNGLNVEQPFIDNGFTDIYRSVLFVTSQFTDQGNLQFKPVASSAIGKIKTRKDLLSTIVECLSTSRFGFHAERNIQPLIWTKVIVNSVFNSVCPLLETDNGIFYRNDEALAIAKRVIRECVGIAALTGIVLTESQVVDSLLKISRFSEGQLISTYQDILNNRMTEIDTLNFAITGIAETLKKENQVRETRLLGELIRLKSGLHRSLSPQNG